MDPYLSEQLAGPKNQLQISSVCNAKCIFCSNDQNPFKIRREGFRKLDDIKEALKEVVVNPKDLTEVVVIGDSIPGRISEGECLLHPQIFEILELIREKYPDNPIGVSTNGTMMTDPFIAKLMEYKPIKVTISYHSDNVNNWMKIFQLPEEKFKIAKRSFKLMRDARFIVRGAIVPMPNLVGYQDMEQTIQWLSRFVIDILMWSPGWTKYTKPDAKELMDTNYEDLSKFFISMRKKHNVDIDFLTDPFIPLVFDPINLMKDSFHRRYSRVGWFISEAAFFRLSNMIEATSLFIPNHHYPIMVKNNTYGGNIICSGLLMVNDFRVAIKEAIEKHNIELAVLPSNANKDNNDLDLMNESYNSLKEEFDIPIWFA